jgi:hypothetical protein
MDTPATETEKTQEAGKAGRSQFSFNLPALPAFLFHLLTVQIRRLTASVLDVSQ